MEPILLYYDNFCLEYFSVRSTSISNCNEPNVSSGNVTHGFLNALIELGSHKKVSGHYRTSQLVTYREFLGACKTCIRDAVEAPSISLAPS